MVCSLETMDTRCGWCRSVFRNDDATPNVRAQGGTATECIVHHGIVEYLRVLDFDVDQEEEGKGDRVT
jgi:hypothetical protein